MSTGRTKGAIARVGGRTLARPAPNISTARAAGAVNPGNRKLSRAVRGHGQGAIVTGTHTTHALDAPEVRPTTPDNRRQDFSPEDGREVSSNQRKNSSAWADSHYGDLGCEWSWTSLSSQ